MALRLVRPPDLWHLTLTTGHGRCSPRNEVADDVVSTLRPLVAAGRGTVHSLTLAVEPSAHGWCWFTLGWGAEVAVFCVLCWDQRGHVEAWRNALEHCALAPAPTAAKFPKPPIPWLTTDVLVGDALRTQEQMASLREAERGLAWALLEEAGTTP